MTSTNVPLSGHVWCWRMGNLLYMYSFASVMIWLLVQDFKAQNNQRNLMSRIIEIILKRE